MKIELFVPPMFTYDLLDFNYLKKLTGKEFHYASKGRHAIGHIISALKFKNNTVLVSPYTCDSVFIKLKQMGMNIKYYDIDPIDLNPSPVSIKKKIEETGAEIVLAASLYGNPADMESIEQICKERNVFLIDDAAQSFGAILNGKYVGCFGNAGLFAFSPGKATAGHMGALFWTNTFQNFKKTRHYMAHKSAWLNFKYNRLLVYNSSFVLRKICSTIDILIQKISSIENDNIETFELKILGGILSSQLDNSLKYRSVMHSYFSRKYCNNAYFRIIQSIRGIANPHKIVLVFDSAHDCEELKAFCKKRQIAFFTGYDLSSNEFDYFPNCVLVRDCIIELPIERNEEHMKYIEETIDIWLDRKRVFCFFHKNSID